MDKLIFAHQPVFQAEAVHDGPRLKIEVTLTGGAKTSLDASADQLPADWKAIEERFTDPLEALVRFLPSEEYSGPWYALIREESEPPEFVLWAQRIHESEELRELLLRLDQHLNLTPQLARALVNAAAAAARSGNQDVSFRWAEAAWRWTRLPHVKILSKDDTAMKFRAAQLQFESGKKSEAIAMVARFAISRVEALEAAWGGGA